jgi:hypothetical protein
MKRAAAECRAKYLVKNPTAPDPFGQQKMRGLGSGGRTPGLGWGLQAGDGGGSCGVQKKSKTHELTKFHQPTSLPGIKGGPGGGGDPMGWAAHLEREEMKELGRGTNETWVCTFSKVVSIVALYSKCTMTLTFEKLWQRGTGETWPAGEGSGEYPFHERTGPKTPPGLGQSRKRRGGGGGGKYVEGGRGRSGAVSMAGFVGFDEGATGPPRPWEVGYGGYGKFGGGSLPMVRDAVQVAMVVNAGQRREMGHLNLVAVRHRKRMMVGRVTAVEERLALVERKLRGEEKSDSEDGEAVSEELAVSRDFRVKIVCGEDKRLMLVPLGVEVRELEEMVEKELNLGIAFTLKVVMNAGNIVPLTSRDVLSQALADTGWISRPSTSAISARNTEARRPLSRGRSRDAKTLQMLVYTMVDKEREEAEAAVEAANKEREEAEAAEREAARELAEAEEAEAAAERQRLEAEAAAHLHTKEEEEAQAAEEEALAKEELAEEAQLKAQTAKATLAAAEQELSELQARQGPKTPEHLDKIKAAQEKVEEAALALAEAEAAAEEAQRARDEAVADAERERREADDARLQAELAQELAEEKAQIAAREREEAEAAQRVAEKEREEANAAQAEADREMSEYLEAKGIAERVHVHVIEEEQAEFEIVMAQKISSAFLGYRVRKDRRKYQELLRMRREEKANVVIVLAVRLCLAKRYVRALKKDRWERLYERGAGKVQKVFRGWKGRRLYEQRQKDVVIIRRELASIKIQRAWRGFLGRRVAQKASVADLVRGVLLGKFLVDGIEIPGLQLAGVYTLRDSLTGGKRARDERARKVKENYDAVLRNAKAVEATDMSRGAKHVYHKVHIQILADYYHFLRVKGVFVLLMNHLGLTKRLVVPLVDSHHNIAIGAEVPRTPEVQQTSLGGGVGGDWGGGSQTQQLDSVVEGGKEKGRGGQRRGSKSSGVKLEGGGGGGEGLGVVIRHALVLPSFRTTFQEYLLDLHQAPQGKHGRLSDVQVRGDGGLVQNLLQVVCVWVCVYVCVCTHTYIHKHTTNAHTHTHTHTHNLVYT